MIRYKLNLLLFFVLRFSEKRKKRIVSLKGGFRVMVFINLDRLDMVERVGVYSLWVLKKIGFFVFV